MVMNYKFYKCSYYDYIISVLALILVFLFKQNLSISSDLIKTVINFTATLCGFILTSISLLIALWSQDSMKMVRKASDSQYIYYLPLQSLKRGIFLICILIAGLFFESVNKNLVFMLASVFLLTQFVMVFLRFLFILNTIFKWVLSHEG